MPKQFTLRKSERLKSRKAIDGLFKNGKRFTVSPIRVYYSINQGEGLQFGTGAITRNFKKAVDRNKVKRLIREAWRLQKNSLQEIVKEKELRLDLFLIYAEKEIPEYRFVYTQVGKIIKRLSAIIDEKAV